MNELAGVPRTIWMLWLQGLPAAPPIVRACCASWQALHPGWEVVVLDERSLPALLGFPLAGAGRGPVSPQVLSDLARVNLLADHGGVWVDATCFCCKPLDEWLGEYLPSGFFAFRNPGPDRLLSNWFLASRRGCRLTAALRDEVNRCWWAPPAGVRARSRLPVRVERLLAKRAALRRVWSAWWLTRRFGPYPYFWFHYLFAEIVRRDDACREVWRRTPDYPAAIPHRLLKAGMCRPPSDELRRDIDRLAHPLYKLSWKRGADRCPPGSALAYLLERARQSGGAG